MDVKENLSNLRREIDQTDAELIRLFDKRMKLVDNVGQIKTKGNLSITDESREEQVVLQAMALSELENKSDAATFVRALIAISKSRQVQTLMGSSIDFPPSGKKPAGAITAAYQGVPGAWGEHSAHTMFPEAELRQCEYFEEVFTDVKNGGAQFGVLPIENYQTGAIGEVYDLLRTRSCYITGQIWIPIKQCLLAPKGAELSGIREIYSHPEGFGQCRRFLKNRNWELVTCRNTAYAAKMVSESGSTRNAAIGSRRAAEVWGLDVLAPDIMDNHQNKTRFIAIAAEPLYDETCGCTSVTFSTPHRSGALCAVLQSFMLYGINLTRIESRPTLSGNRYRFFADLQANILSENTKEALSQASALCEYFEILGCYRE